MKLFITFINGTSIEVEGAPDCFDQLPTEMTGNTWLMLIGETTKVMVNPSFVMHIKTDDVATSKPEVTE